MILDPQAKLLWHGVRAEEFLRTGSTKPVLVEIAPIGYCNARCSWCFFGSRHEGKELDFSVMIDTISDLKTLGIRAINWTGGGEPTLHPNFEHFIVHANTLGIRQGLFTNGYQRIPCQNMFDWIRISLTESGYGAIVRPDAPFGICLNHLPDQNEAEITDLCLKARDFGASYFQIRPALLDSWKEQPRILAPEYLKIYDSFDFKVYVTDYKYSEAIRPREYIACLGYHFCPSIDWNGNVAACLYHSDNPDYTFGNLYHKSILDIWESLPNAVAVMPKCQNCCKNHEINKVLDKARKMEQTDFL